jgi:hypothetical protein
LFDGYFCWRLAVQDPVDIRRSLDRDHAHVWAEAEKRAVDHLSSAKMPPGAALRPRYAQGRTLWHDEGLVTLVRIALRLIEDALRWLMLATQGSRSLLRRRAALQPTASAMRH